MDSELEWYAPEAPQPAFLLRANREVVGRLRFEAGEARRAEGEVQGLKLTFQRPDLHRPEIAIYGGNARDPLAVFTPSWTGGSVTFRDGARYRWNRKAPWSSDWCFHDVEKKESVCVSQHSDSLRHGGRVRVCCGAMQVSEAPVLVLLAWYLRVQDFERLEQSISAVG